MSSRDITVGGSLSPASARRREERSRSLGGGGSAAGAATAHNSSSRHFSGPPFTSFPTSSSAGASGLNASAASSAADIDVARAQQRLFAASLDREARRGGGAGGRGVIVSSSSASLSPSRVRGNSHGGAAASSSAPRTVRLLGPSVIASVRGSSGSGALKAVFSMSMNSVITIQQQHASANYPPPPPGSHLIARHHFPPRGLQYCPMGVWSTNPSREAEGAAVVLALHMPSIRVRTETVTVPNPDAAAASPARLAYGPDGLDAPPPAPFLTIRREVCKDVTVHVATDQTGGGGGGSSGGSAAASLVILSSHHPETGFVAVARRKPAFAPPQEGTSSDAANNNSSGIEEAVVTVKGSLLAPYMRLLLTPRRDAMTTIRVIHVNVSLAETESTRDVSVEPAMAMPASAVPLPPHPPLGAHQNTHNLSAGGGLSPFVPISSLSPVPPPKAAADGSEAEGEEGASPLPTNPSLLFGTHNGTNSNAAYSHQRQTIPEGYAEKEKGSTAAVEAMVDHAAAVVAQRPTTPPTSIYAHQSASSAVAAHAVRRSSGNADSTAAAVAGVRRSNSNGGGGGYTTPPLTSSLQHRRDVSGNGAAFADPLDVIVSPNTPRVGGGGSTTPIVGGASASVSVSAARRQQSPFWLSGTPSPQKKSREDGNRRSNSIPNDDKPESAHPSASGQGAAVPSPLHASSRLAEILFSSVKADAGAIINAVRGASPAEVGAVLRALSASPSKGGAGQHAVVPDGGTPQRPPQNLNTATPSREALVSPERRKVADDAVASATAALERSRQRRRAAAEALEAATLAAQAAEEEDNDGDASEAARLTDDDDDEIAVHAGVSVPRANASGVSVVSEMRVSRSLQPETRAASTVPLPQPLRPAESKVVPSKLKGSLSQNGVAAPPSYADPHLSNYSSTAPLARPPTPRRRSGSSTTAPPFRAGGQLAEPDDHNSDEGSSASYFPKPVAAPAVAAQSSQPRRRRGSIGSAPQPSIAAAFGDVADTAERDGKSAAAPAVALEAALLRQMAALQESFAALAARVDKTEDRSGNNGDGGPYQHRHSPRSAAAAASPKPQVTRMEPEPKGSRPGGGRRVEEKSPSPRPVPGAEPFAPLLAEDGTNAVEAQVARHRALWDEAPTVRGFAELMTEGPIATAEATSAFAGGRRGGGASMQGVGGGSKRASSASSYLSSFFGSGQQLQQRDKRGASADARSSASEGRQRRSRTPSPFGAMSGNTTAQKPTHAPQQAVSICLQPSASLPNNQPTSPYPSSTPEEVKKSSTSAAMPCPFSADDVRGYLAMPYRHFVIAMPEVGEESGGGWVASALGGGRSQRHGGGGQNIVFAAFTAFLSALESACTDHPSSAPSFATTDLSFAPQLRYWPGGRRGGRGQFNGRGKEGSLSIEPLARCRYGFAVLVGGAKTFTLTTHSGLALADELWAFNDSLSRQRGGGSQQMALISNGRGSAAAGPLLRVAAWLDFPSRAFESLFESVAGINAALPTLTRSVGGGAALEGFAYFAALSGSDMHTEQTAAASSEAAVEDSALVEADPHHPLLAFALPKASSVSVSAEGSPSPSHPTASHSLLIPPTIWSGFCVSGAVEDGVLSVNFAPHWPRQWTLSLRAGRGRSIDGDAGRGQRQRRRLSDRIARDGEAEDGEAATPSASVSENEGYDRSSSSLTLVIRSGHILDLLVAADEENEYDGDGNGANGADAPPPRRVGAVLTRSQLQRVERIVGGDLIARAFAAGRLRVLAAPEEASGGVHASLLDAVDGRQRHRPKHSSSIAATALHAMVAAFDASWDTVALWAEEETAGDAYGRGGGAAWLTVEGLGGLVAAAERWQFGSPRRVVLFTSKGEQLAALLSSSKTARSLGFEEEDLS